MAEEGMESTEQDIRQHVGDPDGKTALINKGPVYLSGTSLVAKARAPQAEAESGDKEWGDKVKVVYNVKDTDAPAPEDGSVPTKRIQATESTGKKQKDSPDKGQEPAAEQSVQQEETDEEKAARLEKELEETKSEEGNQTMEKETEKVRVFMSSGGFDIRSYFRDVQYNEKEGYIVLVYHPDDDVALPRKGNTVEIKTEDMEPKVFRLSQYYLRITGTELIACILDETTDSDGEVE